MALLNQTKEINIMTKIINLTGNTIIVDSECKYEVDGLAYITYTYSSDVGNLRTEYVEDVVGLPEPQDGVYYIVMPDVMLCMKGRSDLLTIPSSNSRRGVSRDGYNVVSINVPFLVVVN